MKVKEIYIKDFRQFKNFKLDLTYPKGHNKEGKPLDKVCFIGQNGTGKTNLLKLLFLMRMPGELSEKLNASSKELIDNIAFKVSNSNDEELIVSFKESSTDLYAMSENMMSSFSLPDKEYEEVFAGDYIEFHKLFEAVKKVLSDDPKEKVSKLIYFPSHLKFDLKKEANEGFQQIKKDSNRKVFDFSKESIIDLWNSILQEVGEYKINEINLRQRVSVAAEHGDEVIIKRELDNLKEWKEKTFNPIKNIAENCINPLISKFSLRVKEDLFIQQSEEINFIQIETIDSKSIPYTSWSTGTKQVILTALPLFILQPVYSTILFDEPETSLYPDMQREIIEYFQRFAKDSQFFYSTHSPIISSSFEPWEIVELKYNLDGTVYRVTYFSGDNHINNYFLDPRYLTYDLMLKEVFDMKNTNNDKRYEGLAEYKMLKNQLDKLKEENQLQSLKAKEVYGKFKVLSKKLVVNPEQNA